ncbi:cytochrome-c peroxidase [Schleiferia thermophila]|jgi:cytochrome c peroxidase|uniref:cytochrome-c peroxidase n=1 Tax=Schleiferia thermophila TaxID=884107 RepID=UPI00055E45EA|nr:cytochrome c peroxidase [Schleiferia thermophila]
MNRKSGLWIPILCLKVLFITTSCRGESFEIKPPHRGFPPVPYLEDSPPTASRIQLGKKLFFDKGLSADSTVSCATCHLPELAFTDGKPKSIGHQGMETARNAPTLLNVAWHPYFFREGGNPRLESQMLGPLENREEMANSIPNLIDRINQNSHYRNLFKEAFDTDVIDFYHLARAIALFERSLISGYSRWDRWYYLGDDVLDSTELRGWKLFTGKAGCIACHNGPDLTDYSFQNIGLYEQYSDVGLFRRTRDSSDIGKMKTPTLRNLLYTAPYMHDGSLKSLEEVIEHYDKGGKNHFAKSPLIKTLRLSDKEKSDLIALLKSFSDTILYAP